MIEESFTMPSRGLFEGSVAELTLREMTVAEEKGMFSSKKPFVRMMDLIRACSVKAVDRTGAIVDSMDISKWPLVDMMHALFKLRMVSIDPIYSFTVQCPVCGASVPFGVDLSDGLETTYASDDVTPTYDASLSFGTVTFKQMLVQDHLVLDRMIRQRQAKMGQNFDQGYTLRLAAQIVGVDGEEFGSIATAETWVEKRTSREREEMSAAVEEHSFGDDTSIAVDCPRCGAISEEMMPITRDFLFRGRTRRS